MLSRPGLVCLRPIFVSFGFRSLSPNAHIYTSILGSRPSRSSDVTTVPDGCQIQKLIDFHGFWSKSIDFWWISIIIYAPKWFELLNLLYSMFINSNHLLLVWTFCCEIDEFWWNSMKSHQFLNLTAVWHRGNVGRPRRARTQNWHICAFWLSEFPQLLQKWWKIIKLMIFHMFSLIY